MKRFYRDDMDAMAQLLYESPLDPSFDDGMDDFGGNEPSLDLGGDTGFDDGLDVGVAEIDVMPAAPQTPPVADEDTKALKADLKKLADYAERLNGMDPASFEVWMIAKIAKAADYAADVWHMLDVEADFANTGFEQAPVEQDITF
jgi:hypothetical protein